MGLIAKTKLLVQQFPFIFPKEIIYSCRDWIDSQKNKKGVYFTQRGPWYKTIFDEGFLHHPAPQTLGPPNDKAFYNNRDYPTEKATLFYLQNSFLFGQKGLVLTAGHRIFQEFSHHFGIASLRKFFRKNPFYIFSSGAKYVNGVGAVLVSPESHNYYHWLNDVLPRIKLYEQVLDKIDYFCIASNVPAKFIDVLPAFGIPKNKILLVGEKEKLHFDYLYVSSLPGSEGRSPEWAVNYIRENLAKGQLSKQPSKKIYFKRGNDVERKILNEEAIIKSLQAIGFDVIDPGILNINEQVDLMQQARLVISAHGAALSNLLFCRDKVSVIELFSPDYFRTDCFYTLSSVRGLNYWYIIGDKPAGASWGDILVAEELLIKTIEQTDGK